ncbi:Carboxysome shell and ethanolamine utilization microcompartment protein CcmL/EutN [Dethiosulfatibacter aminovorans DSM 17477]|uniref:Carboxysome shell and ethanolamine utilization microcompartment protein CcmL/EutN n=1 Tax=Dethiosulfatibacter aminovorans DSM 17477 TaxID=1121476 RepID=A0A1M6DQ46_9FIRM|nr:BMC domain-containing protein [Dethiosulfatibacter aminovorans]SHI75279.1 Carboxysome shell and ethanolamine utilization microcompartment protein CcmL/EutN [Dethiosulfatibacter aminovorans DSM 17477]
MIGTIGFLELNSIAKGIEAADSMLKAADVELLMACPTCPGKYHVLISGEVSAVQASIEVGTEIGGSFVIDKCIIPRINSQVIQAIQKASEYVQVNAIGIMEFFSVTASIYAADIAVKMSDISLIDVRLGTGIGGKSFVVLSGDVSAVRAAIDSGVADENCEGLGIANVIIPSPNRELFESLL